MPRFLCQNWQSAAPPAIVPSMYGLISIIFFTDCEAVKITDLSGKHEAFYTFPTTQKKKLNSQYQTWTHKHTDVASHASTGVSSNHYTILENESQRCCALCRFHHLDSFFLKSIKLKNKTTTK